MRLDVPAGEEPNLSSLDDLELARRVANDRASFGILYDRNVKQVYGFCFRRLSSREGAEDATSQTFVKLLAALQKPPRQLGSVRAWIFTIAYHVMIDNFRTSRPTEQIDSITERTEWGSSPETIALERESGDELRRMVERLPILQRDLVYLRLAGLGDREVAHVLGKSYGAIRIGQHRALKQLRTMYEQDALRAEKVE